jgi:hypothetical protein
MGAEMGSWSAAAAAVGYEEKGVEISDWNAGRHVRQLRCFVAVVIGCVEKCAEIGVRTVNAVNITAVGGEKGSEMIFAARAVLDPLPAWLLLVVVAFATYDRQEEVEHGVGEERDREFDLPGDL